MSNEIRCSQCGARLLENSNYCPSCYASVSEKDKKDDTVLEGIEIETWKQYLGDKAVDYLQIFKKHENKRFFFSFNPYAFFLNTIWMYYRKMYLEAIITALVQIVLAVSLALLTTVSTPLMILMFPVAMAFHFCIGAFSYCLYKNHVKRLILKQKNSEKLGGTSYAAAIIGYIASSVGMDIIIYPLIAKILEKL